METNIQIFKNETFGEIRTMTNEKGETFFVGKDVAMALGYSNPLKALRVHVDDEDKGVTEMGTPGGTQKITFINESGLYSLILSSKLPQARAFKRWVTSEVLPAIRRTGRYELLPQEVRLLGEQADYCQRVLQSVDCLTTTQIAKEMGMTGPDLYHWLIALGVIYWQSGQYMLYADYARMGLAKSRTRGRRNSMGVWHTSRYLVWTEEGRKFIHDVMKR
ncbi:MAG: phage antirepressor KilAC domain-containing protein [Prevotella sp.]|nr:phage antirepressor KilAC domain-containing protein [Prevotella sp.]